MPWTGSTLFSYPCSLQVRYASLCCFVVGDLVGVLFGFLSLFGSFLLDLFPGGRRESFAGGKCQVALTDLVLVPGQMRLVELRVGEAVGHDVVIDFLGLGAWLFVQVCQDKTGNRLAFFFRLLFSGGLGLRFGHFALSFLKRALNRTIATLAIYQ